jgi:predicted  nucleic acid-binding Zn-ribbon protein
VRGAYPLPWAYLFVLQELDLQLAALRQRRDLAFSIGGLGSAQLAEEAGKARQVLDATEGRLRELESERHGVVMLLPTGVMGSYDSLRKTGVPPPWVLKLSGPACRGCNGELLPGHVHEARAGRGPVACPACGRLLLWVESSGSASA